MTILSPPNSDAGTSASAGAGEVPTRDAGVIVVGVDGSESSRQALRWAVEEAQLWHDRCQVIEVWSRDTTGTLDRWTRRHLLDARLAGEQAALSAMVDDVYLNVGGVGGVDGVESADAEVRRGDPVEILFEAASGGDLLVIGSGDDGAFRRFLAGSVSNALIRGVGPTVVVPPKAVSRPRYGRVVVGVDGSDRSRHAAQWAKDEATRRGCELVVVHIWHVPVVMASPYAPCVAVPYAQCQESAAEVLAHAVRDLDAGRDLKVIPQLVEGNPEHELTKAAATADLLVIGSRGHGALAAAVLGSASRFCVHHSPCAVAVIPDAIPNAIPDAIPDVIPDVFPGVIA